MIAIGGGTARAAGEAAAARAKKEASRWLDRGNSFYDAKLYPEALASYRRALGLYRSPMIEFNVAEAYRQLGNWAMADLVYERLTSDDERGPPQKIRQAALARIELMKAEAGSIAFDGDLTGATLTIDGAELGPPPGRPLLVKPGTHRVAASRQGMSPFKEEVEIGGRESATVQVRFAAIDDDDDAGSVVLDTGRQSKPVAAVPQIGMGEAALEAHGAREPAAVRVEEPHEVASKTSSDGSIVGTWWFWTAIGVVLAGGVTAGAVALHSGSSDPSGASHFSQWQRY